MVGAYVSLLRFFLTAVSHLAGTDPDDREAISGSIFSPLHPLA